MNPIHNRWRKILFLALVVLFLSLAIVGEDNDTFAQTEGGDLLAYTIPNYDEGIVSLMLYDPHSGTHLTLLRDIDFGGFHFSSDGRIAWSIRNEVGESEIFVFDIHTPDQPPLNLSQMLNLPGQSLGWSHDGRYLAFVSPGNFTSLRAYKKEGDTTIPLHEPTPILQDIRSIYVWDGEIAINITPDEMIGSPESYGVAWSYDGRLAFTIRLWISADYSEYEIYLWDGSTTTNLSQNPTGRDQNPIWNDNGEMIFSSTRDGEHGLFLWNSMSVEDGLPDIDTFINIESSETIHYLW